MNIFKNHTPLILAFVLLMSLDVILTYFGILNGATEVNPILVLMSANTNFAILIVLKIIAILAIIYLSTLFKNEKQTTFSLGFINFVMLAVVIYNLIQLKSHGVI